MIERRMNEYSTIIDVPREETASLLAKVLGITAVGFLVTAFGVATAPAWSTLPGLIAVSVWITLAISLPLLVGSRRFSALMMPLDMDWSSPNGLPIANAIWPTLRSEELPIATGGGNSRALLIRNTARS